MTEEKWIQEFEKIWKEKGDGILQLKYLWVKSFALWYWIESRRRLIAQLKKDSKLAGFDVEEWEGG
jgi:hypothetical protein